MKKTLLLRLHGPMQSWGVSGFFGNRDTSAYPSKSGVLGLVAAALGINRGAIPTELLKLSMGTKIIKQGLVLKDFQTAMNVIKYDGGKGDTVLSHRFYLHDAWFIAGISCQDSELLNSIYRALRNPRWPLYLGRKSCPPSLPVHLSEPTELSLFDALSAFEDPLLPENSKKENVLLIEECEANKLHTSLIAVHTIYDQPMEGEYRYFLPRKVYQFKL